MTTSDKKLDEARKAGHEKTWQTLRSAMKDAQIPRMNDEGAMADCHETVAVMRKHLLAIVQFLGLNFPRNGVNKSTDGSAS